MRLHCYRLICIGLFILEIWDWILRPITVWLLIPTTTNVSYPLLSENVNFLTADGLKFAHPLHHLGKSTADLPLIAIDSFRHMYLFSSYEDMSKPDKLKNFLKDLYSGKLHREFHYGPDTNNERPEFDGPVKSSTPPESTFKKLAPSRNRYTLLKDEL